MKATYFFNNNHKKKKQPLILLINAQLDCAGMFSAQPEEENQIKEWLAKNTLAESESRKALTKSNS